MNYINEAIKLLRRDGPYQLLKKGVPFIYNRHVAPLLPRRTVNLNGVEVSASRFSQTVLPWKTEHRPHYESGLISGIEDYVQERDSVVIVGGGYGPTAVRAAQKVGKSGKVYVYEGSAEETKYVEETAEINNVSERVKIIHGIVGPKISLRGEQGNAIQVPPEELPECDVLELDCEGAEVEILQNIKVRPRVILVESHGINDASSSKVEGLLKELSYSVKSKEVADKGKTEFCIDNDIYTLIAVRQ
jgi:hypothetical protein